MDSSSRFHRHWTVPRDGVYYARTTRAGKAAAVRDHTAIISVVFSFRNEEAVLPELLARTRAVLGKLVAESEIGGYELIFVNDDSTDASEEMLRAEADQRGDVRLVNMSRNFGVSPCVLAGFEYALGDAVVYLDADLQDPPEVIPELIRRWQSDPEVEVVHTVRRSRDGETRVKRALTALGYRALGWVSEIDLPYEAGDFKLLSRRAADYVIRMKEKRPFLRGLVRWIGFKQEFVHYDRQARFAGKTKFPVLGLKVIRNFFDSALISFSDAPLKLAGWLGMVLMLAGSGLIAGLAVRWLASAEVPGWPIATAVILLIGGVQLLSVGILGSYVGAIYWESKGRPNYIVRDTYGFAAGLGEAVGPGLEARRFEHSEAEL